MTHQPLTKAERDLYRKCSAADGYYAEAIDRLCADLAKLAAAESAHSELFLSGQVAELRAKLAALVEMHPFSEWHDDDGPVLWFYLPVREPPFYVGTPSDDSWPFDGDPDGLDDHTPIGWSRMPPIEEDTRAAIAAARGGAS